MIERLLRGAFDRAADIAGLVSHRVWRVGHMSAPLDFVPHEYCSWEHRFAQFQLDQGVPVEELAIPAREVTAVWRQSHALAPARVIRDGPLVDLDDPALLEELATRHATLLAEHGMAQLNVSEIRSKNRHVTQTIGRDLYDRGVAGILFRSNQDNKRCLVVMEGRSRLEEDGQAIPLTDDVPELLLVCSQYNLTLKASGTGEARSIPTIWRP